MNPQEQLEFEAKATAFIEGVVSLARQYNVSLGHQDGQGAFIVVKTAQENMFAWLRAAEYEDQPWEREEERR